MLWMTVLYAAAAMTIGFWKYMRCASMPDYLLGSRTQYSRVAGMSAQTALLGFFFTVTVPMISAEPSGGALKAIFASAGMVLGIFLSKFLISRRLRIYSELSGNSLSFPDFLENRFNDKSGVLRAVSASVILVFGILLSANLFSLSASLIDGITQLGYIQSLIICGLLVAVFVFLGGLPAVVSTGYIKALALLIFFVFILIFCFNPTYFDRIAFTDAAPLSSAAGSLSETDILEDIFSDILCFAAYSLLFFGIPFINTAYMSTKERRVPKRKIFAELFWTVPSAAGAVMTGIIVSVTGNGHISTVSEMVGTIYKTAAAPTGSLIVSLIFIICITTSDTSLFTAGESLVYDLFTHGKTKYSAGKNGINTVRFGVLGAAAAAILFALFAPQTEFLSTEFLISAVSAAFGPTVLFCLFFNCLTTKGAVASVAGGLAAAALFNYLELIDSIPEIPVLIPGFVAGTVFLFAVSLLDRKNISEKTGNEFGRTKEIARLK
ncbi:MAG: hypothetical protein J5816_03155 [Clostridia bacterium]|nr:hypothetical protein [Clostridia bacterium]